VMGLGDALKAWKAGHLKAYTVFMLIAIGAVGLGMMSSTTAVRINWIRVLAANLARATSTTAVVLLLLAFRAHWLWMGDWLLYLICHWHDRDLGTG
jgi:hypothetical protein